MKNVMGAVAAIFTFSPLAALAWVIVCAPNWPMVGTMPLPLLVAMSCVPLGIIGFTLAWTGGPFVKRTADTSAVLFAVSPFCALIWLLAGAPDWPMVGRTPLPVIMAVCCLPLFVIGLSWAISRAIVLNRPVSPN
ncbi:hypothetical protein [Nitrospirillum viridazoti]|nr:hypothetical protein [Nitrospirillum amazonense]